MEDDGQDKMQHRDPWPPLTRFLLDGAGSGLFFPLMFFSLSAVRVST